MASPARSLPAQSEAFNQAEVSKEKVLVAVRIRPLLKHEELAGEKSAWTATGTDVLTCIPDEKSSCTFDKVFAEHVSSEAVYESVAQQLVLSAMQGYNSTVFAYGQTGAGTQAPSLCHCYAPDACKPGLGIDTTPAFCRENHNNACNYEQRIT